MNVEFAYAEPDQQVLIARVVPAGTTVAEVLALVAAEVQAGKLALDVDLGNAPVGVFGEVCQRDRVLIEGDRVEVYRALIVDPMERRRRLAQGKGKA